MSTRLLVIDPAARSVRTTHVDALADFLRAGDLLVVNDAATLPASLAACTERGEPIELRLLGPPEGDVWTAVLLGAGDYRMRTEDRPPPVALSAGARIIIAPELGASVIERSTLSERLVRLRFDVSGAALWTRLYRHGRPVQYAYQREPLALWSVQTLYAARPWASEMPSAGRFLSMRIFERLRRRGVPIAHLTHAAGLSATGDPAIDRALPLPERYDLPQATVDAVRRCRERGGRVIAVGTSVVRALESAYVRGGGVLIAGEAVTSLRIDRRHRLAVVDGLVTGIHTPEESHFDLLRAFLDEQLLSEGHARARALGYRLHEFGDVSLIVSSESAGARSAKLQIAGARTALTLSRAREPSGS
jgi:S-adenosylmethionine:tRNA ribosyltransferase-isomerase